MAREESWRRSFEFHTDIDQIEENEWKFSVDSFYGTTLDFSVIEWDEKLYVFCKTTMKTYVDSWYPLMILPNNIDVERLLTDIYGKNIYFE